MNKKLYSKRLFPRKSFMFLVMSGLATVSQLTGQIFVSETGSYFQDFDSLPSSGSSNTIHTWENNTTLPGWYIDSQVAGGAVTEIRTGPHTSNSTSIYVYSFGSPLNDPDRSLGAVQTNTNGANAFAFGLQFQNNSGADVTFTAMSFWGEQYRYSGATLNTNSTWYKISTDPINSPSISSDDWMALADLDFTSPAYNTNNPDALSSGAVTNGNSENYRTFVSADLDITVGAGEYIMFRFLDPDYSGTDHGLGYDDVSVSWVAVPEPAHSAFLSGLLLVGIIVFVRRRRR